jgi:hypothetical protein
LQVRRLRRLAFDRPQLFQHRPNPGHRALDFLQPVAVAFGRGLLQQQPELLQALPRLAKLLQCRRFDLAEPTQRIESPRPHEIADRDPDQEHHCRTQRQHPDLASKLHTLTPGWVQIGTRPEGRVPGA